MCHTDTGRTGSTAGPSIGQTPCLACLLGTRCRRLGPWMFFREISYEVDSGGYQTCILYQIPFVKAKEQKIVGHTEWSVAPSAGHMACVSASSVHSQGFQIIFRR